MGLTPVKETQPSTPVSVTPQVISTKKCISASLTFYISSMSPAYVLRLMARSLWRMGFYARSSAKMVYWRLCV